LWDTAGQEKFRSLIPTYIKDAIMSAIVFDVSDKKTFDNVNMWNESIQAIRAENSMVILIGNKLDLKEKIAVTT